MTQANAEVARLTAEDANLASQLAEREQDHQRWVVLNTDHQQLQQRYTALLDKLDETTGTP